MTGKIRRPSWDESFMLAAALAAARSSCLHLKTGAVIVSDKRIVASGYNGAPPGIRNCLEVGCRKDREHVPFEVKGKGVCRGIHAEINALSQVARYNLKGASMYSLFYPCSGCAKTIAGNGIKEVVYLKDYGEIDSLTQELFSEARVKLRSLEMSVEDLFDQVKYVLTQNERKI